MTLTISQAVGPESPPVRDITIGQLLRDAAATVPDRVAIIEGISDASARRRWTYAQLDADADRVARALLARYAPGDHIAVWAQNIPEWELLEFGVARAGMVIVTVNPGYHASELGYVLKQSRATALFCVDAFRGNPMLATANEVQPDCPALREVVRFAEWDSFLDSGDSFSGGVPGSGAHGSGDDPVHVRHHGLPQGRVVAPPWPGQQRNPLHGPNGRDTGQRLRARRCRCSTPPEV